MFSLRFRWVRNFTIVKPRSAKICRDYMTDDLMGPTVARFSSHCGRLALLTVEYRVSRFIVTIVGIDWSGIAGESEIRHDIDPSTVDRRRCD
ncbi:hypothetical protein TIFTF001_006844 [Ficus carica]|uniref:Uncharacterized protein n=1 Tax=Ficus carica TaxID=3494 RepID=A0AA87ZPT0_FICCA|nr:hypothetical protein TIFTF001_006844 [Ficus carica]